jgi:hypothetical protein
VKKLTALASIVFATFVIAASPASAALPNQRTDLKVLLLSATGDEPTTGAWETALKREGVPYEEKIATHDDPYTADTFADTLADGTPHAKYQAVVIATGGLVYADEAGNWGSALSSDEWAALADFESRYGIRQVTAFTWPSAEYGLNSPTVSGDLSGVVGNLTTEGQKVFPYLKGQVPLDKQTYGYRATPATGANFKTLVAGPSGSALLGINTRPDGREEMVSTVDQNQYMLHNQLLRHGMLSWVTRGTYLGTERNYLTVQVDDVFEESERWDTATNTETTVSPLRMTANDVLRAVLWSYANGFRIDMAFNGDGADEAGSRDALTQYLLYYKSAFNWINHTYSHPNLDNSTLAEIKTNVQKNIDWARAHRLPIDPTELVTGEHSGLFNPNMSQAMTDLGIKWFGDDASRRPGQWTLGPALSVPRYPTNVYYNAATRTQQLDEYNYLYLPPSLGGKCENTATTTCFTQAATWNEYVDREAATMLRHMLSNDPRPHYMHQANLAKDGTFYSVVGEALRRYRAYFKPVIVQPLHKQAAQLLQTQDKWSAVKDQVNAFIQNGKINLSSLTDSTIQVPITGIPSLGVLYGGLTSGWQQVGPGGTLQLNLPL